MRNNIIQFQEKEGKSEPLPEVKSNTEIKQLATAITGLIKKLEEATPQTKKII